MIVEIPHPKCVPLRSGWRQRVKAARDFVENTFGPISKSEFKPIGQVISVAGIGFFDVAHGTPQRGVAKNLFELHPVLGICAGNGCDPYAP